jgi:Alpha/beta hydrolase family
MSSVRSRRQRLARVMIFAMVLLGLAGCSAGGQLAASPSTSTAMSAASMVPPQQYCTGVQVPSGVEQRSLTAPDGSVINTVWLGLGTTTAVLLHQTDGNGLCGMLFYASYLADHGIRTVAIDLCGYSQSFCQVSSEEDPVGQVMLVTDALRAGGARRITLVGASMGGSLAVAAASRTGADAVVDLSGPARFNSLDIKTSAPSVTMPILIVFGELTDPDDLAAVRAQLPAMPTRRKQLLVLDQGHGIELLRRTGSTDLSPLAGKVLGWVRSS